MKKFVPTFQLSLVNLFAKINSPLPGHTGHTENSKMNFINGGLCWD